MPTRTPGSGRWSLAGGFAAVPADALPAGLGVLHRALQVSVAVRGSSARLMNGVSRELATPFVSKIEVSPYGPIIHEDAAATGGIEFTRHRIPATATNFDITLATVVRFETTAGARTVGLGATTNNGIHLQLATAQLSLTKGGVADIPSGITITADVWYFLAASYDATAGQVQYLVKDLATGVVRTATVANGSAFAASDGIAYVAHDRNTPSINSYCAGGWIATTRVTLETLRRWAVDPFVFNRPQRRLRYAVAGGGVTLTATRATATWTAASPSVVLSPTAGFLSIAGIAVPVLEGQAVERTDWRGESYRAVAGNLRAQVRAEKLAWSVTTGLMTATERTALLAATAFKAHVACAGVGLPGTVTCEVTIGETAEVNTSAADGTGLLYSLALVLRAV